MMGRFGSSSDRMERSILKELDFILKDEANDLRKYSFADRGSEPVKAPLLRIGKRREDDSLESL